MPNGLNLSPSPAIPTLLPWKTKTPPSPAVSGNWVDTANEVWPLAASVMFCVPSRLPLSSQLVAVKMADEVDRFAKATPVAKPPVLS